jgi:DNA-3-methyladenine glycosylase II
LESISESSLGRNLLLKYTSCSNLGLLTEDNLREGVKYLTQIDPHLAKVVSKYGSPPIWEREPGFPTLIKIILEQQVSLASAQAAYDKLIETVKTLTPETFMVLSSEDLKRIGFSSQKTKYGRILAQSIIDEHLNMDSLNHLTDDEIHDKLTSIKGIGPWTAGIYSLMALKRPDVWPRGDLALLKAMKEVKELQTLPSDDDAEKIASNWRPWRAVAARILWHYYLSTR